MTAPNMLLAFAIFVACVIALSVFVIEREDRRNRSERLSQSREELRRQIDIARRQHKPRNHLYDEARELTSRELRHG